MRVRVNDILLIGLFAAMLITMGMLFWPLFPLLPTPALRGLVLAPLYGAIVSVLLRRAGYQGALILFALVAGIIMIIFTPFLLPVTFGAALISELVGLILGRLAGQKKLWTKSPVALTAATALFTALQFPLMLYTLALFGGPGGEILIHPIIIIGFTIVGAILGWTGCRLGYAIEKRLVGSKENEQDHVPERHTGEKGGQL